MFGSLGFLLPFLQSLDVQIKCENIMVDDGRLVSPLFGFFRRAKSAQEVEVVCCEVHRRCRWCAVKCTEEQRCMWSQVHNRVEGGDGGWRLCHL